jgi:hypothetical protein
MITHTGSSNFSQALYDLKNLSRFEILDPKVFIANTKKDLGCVSLRSCQMNQIKLLGSSVEVNDAKPTIFSR